MRDSEVERAGRLRIEYRERAEEALEGLDLLLDTDAPDRRATSASRRRARRSGRARVADPFHVSHLGARLARARTSVRPGRGRSAGVASDRRPRRRGRPRPRCGTSPGAKPDLKLRRTTADEDLVMIAVRRLLLLAVLGVLALALSGVAEARIDRPAITPQGLTAFLLRTDEPVKHEFDRTPSFAWLPVRGAIRYEFELATSKSFTESSIVWSNANDEFVAHGDRRRLPPATPASTVRRPPPSWQSSTRTCARRLSPSTRVALDHRLALRPLRTRPRDHEATASLPGAAPTDSTSAGRASRRDLNSPHPGLVRWSPVDGATAYQVWLYGAKRTFMTTTNVADARDLYSFHRTNPFFTGSITVPRPRTASALR